jgi:hypothetical protein
VPLSPRSCSWGRTRVLLVISELRQPTAPSRIKLGGRVLVSRYRLSWGSVRLPGAKPATLSSLPSPSAKDLPCTRLRRELNPLRPDRQSGASPFGLVAMLQLCLEGGRVRNGLPGGFCYPADMRCNVDQSEDALRLSPRALGGIRTRAPHLGKVVPSPLGH